jgi:hypothetical protein
MNWIINSASPLHGTVSMPGDKSISHRAMMRRWRRHESHSELSARGV